MPEQPWAKVSKKLAKLSFDSLSNVLANTWAASEASTWEARTRGKVTIDCP